ncbi:tetratricopeptide repeat protein [Sphingopyxis sp.]|uniref:tetratricopeptide repeat protein n=1 Tax=Sphingopyxis sp. TaxID=1908224 RepID=UPI003BAA2348
MFTRFRQMPATAMAAVLGCALIASAAPAAAKDKPKKEETKKAAEVPVSKGFTPAVKKMIDATAAKDAAALQAALAESQAGATEAGDRYWHGYYTLQLGLLNKDTAAQDKGLDAMLDSGVSPAESLGAYNFYSGNFSYVAKNYPKAIQRLEAAQAAGSKEASLSLLLMDSYLNSNQVDKGVALAKSAIEASRAAGQRPSEELYVRPAKALQAAKRTDDLLDILTLRVRDWPQPAVWRNTLYILLQQSGDNKDMTLDVLRLMRATNAMTERGEYLEYAALATEAGYPGEVVSIIEQGVSKSVFQKNDAKFGPILETQGERFKADRPGLLADANKPPANPKAARATADALVGIGEYAKAIPLYEGVAASDPVALYRLGVAQALAGQKDAASATFAKITGDRTRLAKLWTVHIQSPPPAPAAPAAAPATGS